MSAVAIIPARWASTRFPGKPLALLAGKPLVQHVWERCLRAKKLSRVIVATDDMRIAEAAFDFGAEIALTSPKHPTGSDRLAEVAAKLRGVSCILNVQGDEPMIAPRLIDQLVGEMLKNPRAEMVTAATPFADPAAVANPNNVKVVTDRLGNALYFSRSPIPFDRDGTGDAAPLHHLGIYGYRRSFLLKFVKWKPTPLEQSEKLEQLRALEMGARIRVVVTKDRSIGVDTPEDLAAAEKLL
jgi:3-deoxy-manno-octulosonate cytidylyltransferase (CMP-KDO synthetase)